MQNIFRFVFNPIYKYRNRSIFTVFSRIECAILILDISWTSLTYVREVYGYFHQKVTHDKFGAFFYQFRLSICSAYFGLTLPSIYVWVSCCTYALLRSHGRLKYATEVIHLMSKVPLKLNITHYFISNSFFDPSLTFGQKVKRFFRNIGYLLMK